MARKKETNEEITKIKKALEDKKLVIGTENTLKNLKKASLSEIYLTANSPPADGMAKFKIAPVK